MSNAYIIKNPEEIIVSLKGEEYTIMMDMNAMERLEDTYGTIKNAFEAFGFKMEVDAGKQSAANVMETVKISNVKKFLWASLATYHEDDFETAKDVGKLIGMGEGFQVALDAIFTAIGTVQDQAETASEMLSIVEEVDESDPN